MPRTLLLFPILLALTLQNSPRASAQTGLPEAVAREVARSAELPAGTYTLVRSWSAAGPPAAHQYGHAAQDPGAQGGRAWEARVGIDAPNNEMIYGPYFPVPAGDYVALYRLKLGESAGEEPVAHLDAAVNNGQDILATRDLRGSDLTPGRWAQAPLAFHCPGGRLECRLSWSGYASLQIDTISLYRLKGGQIPPPRRAPEAVLSGQPRDLIYRPEQQPFPDLFPRSPPPASRLVLFDVRRQPPDWQFLLFSLQGLVNRTRPSLYYLFNPTDPQWLNWMRRRGWVHDTEHVQRPEELLSRYRRAYRGIIITDPDLPASKNVATMLAGVLNGLVASPRLAQRLRLPVLEDLRGRWKTSTAAYQWAFDHLWPRLNHYVIACSYPDHLALRDYLVANRVFIFWISGPLDGARPYANPTAEARLMERLLARMPANIPVMSYPWAGKDVGIGEGPGVTLFAEFAKYLVGTIDCSNLTVHSGIRTGPLRQHPAPPAPPLRRDRIYVSWIMSDGDNLPVLTTNNFPQRWNDWERGKFAIGWTVSPSAEMLIPDIVDFYYRNCTPNDRFLGAVSGVGYTYPDSYGQRFRAADRAAVFDGFLSQTRQYMASMDLKEEWPMGVTRESLLRRYGEQIRFLNALFPDYGRRVAGYEDATYPMWTTEDGGRRTYGSSAGVSRSLSSAAASRSQEGRLVPVFHALTNWAEVMPREQQIASLVAQVRAATPPTRPAFMHLFVLNWFADLPMLQEVLRRLGPEYIAVRPDHLAHLYQQELALDQVLVRMPADISVVEGRREMLSATVQNVTARPMTLRLQATSGLTDVRVQPDRVALAPGQTATVEFSGVPSGGRLTLQTAGPFGIRTAQARLTRLGANELVGSLPEGGALRFVRQWEAATLAHRSGRPELDAQAQGRAVWTARPGQSDEGYVVFGPYAPLPAGRFLALFRLKRLDGGSGTAAVVDTCTNGGTRITATRTLDSSDLPVGGYRLVPLVFVHPGGEIETRVQWPGTCGIAVDTISMWQLGP